MNKKAKIDLYKRVCKEISRRKTGNAYEFLSVNTEILNEWCEKMNIEQGERTDEEMMNFINEYEYDDDDTYFYIRQFTFE